MEPWRRQVRMMLATFAGLVAVATVMVAVANPYGNLPFSPMRHVIMDTNQRYQYPAVIRSQRYDSLVVGTSTGRLLAPARLEALFGGRFANLGLDAGTAWEQMRIARLFRETVPKPGTLLIALDHVWCDAEADRNRTTPRGFPEWMFDADPWNDAPYMLNWRSVEIAGRRIGHALGLLRQRWAHDGYEVFVPPEAQYDLAKARRNLWGLQGVPAPAPAAEDIAASRGEPAAEGRFAFPALAWLEAMLDRSNGFRRVVMLTTPVHRAALPRRGSEAHAREQACKAAMAVIARRHGVALVDFRILSPITVEDQNYWDPLHYRVPIADRIVDGLARALASGRDDPAGEWRLLSAAADSGSGRWGFGR